ncbi:unnamed protein product [Allacma fusca]|uniref:ZP domain-containing protein n=1 Tax=Allacma fusca TaxID=39272 RepID=A0A8J2JLU7_9HEXA|nr:unnamed protein product [Allacma fusca]
MRTFDTLRFVLLLIVFYFPLIEKVSSDGLLKDMKADCINDGIRVHLVFQKPFYGVAYSFGHYENDRCRYIGQDSNHTGLNNYSFLIPVGECGTIQHGATSTVRTNAHTPNNHSESRFVRNAKSSERKRHQAQGSNVNGAGNEIYIENTLLIQHDASIQEAGDLAQKLRCVWQKEIHKPLVASLPFQAVNRRIQPLRFPAQYKHERRGNVSSVSTEGVRFESKGQVESVPYYNYKRKWSRSLRAAEDNLSEESGGPGPIPLPLSSAQNRGTSWQSSLGILALCTLGSCWIWQK